MTNSGESLERRQAIRLAVLKYMYEVAVNQENNPRGKFFNARTIAEATSISEDDVDTALTYLNGEGFIGLEARPYDGLTPARISHSGIKEVEEILSQPKRGTGHFPPQVVQHFYSSVGTVQNAPNATAYVTQNIGADLSSIFVLIEQLRQQVDELPEDEQEEAQVDLDTLEAELKDGKEPKKIRVLTKRLTALGRGAEAAVGFGTNVTTLVTQAQALGLL